MSENELKDTQPTPTISDTQPNSAIPAGKKNFPRWLAALVFVVLIAAALLGGYGSGMGERYAAQDTLVTSQNLDQFNLGIQAMDAGQYEIAKVHFESVIQNNPDFPGIRAAYTDLLLRMQTSFTPTFTPSPVATSTPDLRSAEEKFNSANQLLSAPVQGLCSNDWSGIINTLDSLRKAAPTYRTAEVDGMYYIALRSRGICKIYPQGYQLSYTPCENLNLNLEGGIYDLTLAERFVGSLDATADSLRTSARLYIVGASFWDQDWAQAQNFFSQVMSGPYPNIMDASCETATERWRQATIKYAEQLMTAGDFCGAEDQFNAAFSINSHENEAFYPTATAVQPQCNRDGESGGAGGGEVPTIAGTPSETPTPGETPTPSETPTTTGP